MKKFYLLFLISVLPALGFAADTWSLSIDSQEVFDSWTFIDANNDDKTWYYDATVNGARYDYHSSNQANDWLISPAVVLTAGKVYEITGYVQIPKAMQETFVFTIGRGATVEAQTGNILLEKSVSGSQSSYQAYTMSYSPEEDGEYNIAIKATTPKNRYYIYFQKFEVKEKLEYPGAPTAAEAMPADNGALAATLKWVWPTLNSDGYSLSSGIKGAKIYRTNSSWASVGDNICIATLDIEDAQPGAEATYLDTEVPEKGNYYYYVRAVGDNGDSPVYASLPKVWVGADELAGISNLKGEVSDDMSSVTLSWSGPAKNGGYVDMTGAGYRIVRCSMSTGEDVELETQWKGVSPYVDNSVLVRDNYKYTVTFTHPDLTSASSSSVTVKAGSKGAMPYTNNLTYSYYSDNNGADLVSLFHVNGTRDWSKDSSGMYIYYSGTDAWFTTPALPLEPGKVYEMTFDTRTGSAYYSRDLGVYIGTRADKDNLPQTNLFAETISSTTLTTKTVYFNVDAAGDYYIAFNGKASSGTSTSYSLYVKNLSVKEVVLVPGMPSGFVAIPATEGELSARLTWVNPQTDNAGGTLSAIDRVDVLRDNVLIKSFENVAPGGTMEWDDKVSAAGEYTYSVVAYLGDNGGEAAEASAWIGPDEVTCPETVDVTVGETEAIVTWTPVTTGVHGGYVDASQVRYTVWRGDKIVASDLATEMWVDTEINSLELGNYVYGVSASYAGNDSEITVHVGVTLGGALQLPYNPSFSEASTFDIWTLDGWALNSGKLRASTTEAWAFTPPFMALDGTISLEFEHNAYSGRYPMKLYVYLATSTDKNPDEHVLLRDEANDRDYFLHDSSYGSNAVQLTVPVTDKKYHIGFRTVENTMYGYLNKVHIAQDITTGIDSVADDGKSVETRYFNLQGVEVSGNIAPGLYIVKKGNSTEKIFVK